MYMYFQLDNMYFSMFLAKFKTGTYNILPIITDRLLNKNVVFISFFFILNDVRSTTCYFVIIIKGIFRFVHLLVEVVKKILLQEKN